MNEELYEALMIVQIVMIGVVGFLTFALFHEQNEELMRLRAEISYTKSEVKELEKEVERNNDEIVHFGFVTEKALSGEW